MTHHLLGHSNDGSNGENEGNGKLNETIELNEPDGIDPVNNP